MSADRQPVLEVESLAKTFRIGFFRKKVQAVREVSFAVPEGSIFGLLGPNGAGKTTTIKMILRLIFPDRGTIRIFGRSNENPAVMARLGYMPENPYVYQYLRPLEFLDLCGRLMGMDAARRAKRSAEMIELVGLGHATDRPIGKFSKGMTQRIGLAQSLLHEPELLILDEPMSGLDPVGRKEVRDVLLEQRKKGRTLLFTSHILSDVEMLCDHAVIMQRGKVAASGSMADLLRPTDRQTEIVLGGASQDLARELAGQTMTQTREGDGLTVVVEGDAATQEVVGKAVAAGAAIVSVTPKRETLEAFFLRGAGADDDAGAAGNTTGPESRTDPESRRGDDRPPPA